jgi:hypothetical protein
LWDLLASFPVRLKRPSLFILKSYIKVVNDCSEATKGFMVKYQEILAFSPPSHVNSPCLMGLGLFIQLLERTENEMPGELVFIG